VVNRLTTILGKNHFCAHLYNSAASYTVIKRLPSIFLCLIISDENMSTTHRENQKHIARFCLLTSCLLRCSIYSITTKITSYFCCLCCCCNWILMIWLIFNAIYPPLKILPLKTTCQAQGFFLVDHIGVHVQSCQKHSSVVLFRNVHNWETFCPKNQTSFKTIYNTCQ